MPPNISESFPKEGREELQEVGKGGQMQRKRDKWKTERGNGEEGGVRREELRKEGKATERKGGRKVQRGKGEQKGKEVGRKRLSRI